MAARDSVPDAQSRDNPTNDTTEYNPWLLSDDLTDRELLAIFVEKLLGPDTAYLDLLESAINDDLLPAAEWASEADQGHLHVLREALRLAEQRGEGGAS